MKKLPEVKLNSFFEVSFWGINWAMLPSNSSVSVHSLLSDPESMKNKDTQDTLKIFPF